MAATTLQGPPLPISASSPEITPHPVTLPSQILFLHAPLPRKVLPTPVFALGVPCASWNVLAPLPSSSAKPPMASFYAMVFLTDQFITLFISSIKFILIYIKPTCLCAYLSITCLFHQKVTSVIEEKQTFPQGLTQDLAYNRCSIKFFVN